MQPFHTIDVYEMCGEVVLSQGVILSAHCAMVKSDSIIEYTVFLYFFHEELLSFYVNRVKIGAGWLSPHL